MLELSLLRKLTNFEPIFFVRVPPSGSRTVDTDPPDGAPKEVSPESSTTNHSSVTDSSPSAKNSHSAKHVSLVYEQLQRLGYLDPEMKQFKKNYYDVESIFVEKFTDFSLKIAVFVKKILQSYAVNASSVLNNSHTRCLNKFILSAFDMARDMLITPKKLEFAREKEEELYKSLLKISVSKLDEIKELISTTISMIRTCLIAEAAEFEFIGKLLFKSSLGGSLIVRYTLSVEFITSTCLL